MDISKNLNNFIHKAQGFQISLFKRLLHASVFLFNTSWMVFALVYLALNYDENHPCEFFHHGFRYFPFFLSLWVTTAQYIYFGMYAAIDFLELYYKDSKLVPKYTSMIHQVASYLLFTIVFPLSWSVLVFFWGVYLYDRSVIYPEILDLYIPQWMNHAMHTIPVPLTVVYMVTSNRVEPPKQATLAGLVAFVSTYLSIFLMIRLRDGKWIYLVFEVMSPAQTKMIFTSVIICCIAFHMLGYKVNEAVNYLKKNMRMALV